MDDSLSAEKMGHKKNILLMKEVGEALSHGQTISPSNIAVVNGAFMFKTPYVVLRSGQSRGQ